MSTNNNVPGVIPVITKSWDGVWLYTFRCPLCSKLHTHGGGGGEHPARFGVRVSHCKDDQGVYDIVNPTPLPGRPDLASGSTK
ncbi:hypothetical protein RCO28_30460 [Streptomyces sp. LHD-70]|uniref:hypothetical protein n=1 Tax=Streptomyces sp. LHD-70 TaxID=3072140 RepID=UPI00280DDB41|nr:hypothetical protein [Streptomyces sp. LHD-70]MDQ8706763.1 hypothetical protein [Streptomyces sp. LHD-70]